MSGLSDIVEKNFSIENVKDKTYSLDECNALILNYYNKMENDTSESEFRKKYDYIDNIRAIIKEKKLDKEDFANDTLSMTLDPSCYYPVIKDKKDDNSTFREELFSHRDFKDCLYRKKSLPEKGKVKEKDDELMCMNDSMFKSLYKRFPWQEFVKNYISPHSPYNGLLLWWDVGVGKTGAAIAIAEQFKKQLVKNGKKITVILPGQKLKENWLNEICDVDKYLSTGNINALSTGAEYLQCLKGIDISERDLIIRRVRKEIYNY